MGTSDTGVGQAGVSTLRARAPRSTRSIGAPLAGTTVRVLDRFLRPVAQGGIGELYVAGDQLARGYLDDPAATAASYVADPYGPSGSRMYRTGDLVRWSEAEGLVFLGRTDAQVKIRGFRVDLAEIETDLRQVGGVVEAYGVFADGALHGVVTTERGGPTGGAIRETLRARVPAYRVPASVAVVERIPLTARGKVDRRRLEALVGRPAAPDRLVPPVVHDPRLEALLAVFGDVLGRDDIGPDTDFFDAGGHSLTALRLVARANDALGAGLTARDVFGAGTPRGLLHRLDERGRHAPAPDGEPRTPHGPPDGQPAAEPQSGELTPTQLGMWYLERTLGNGSLYTVSVALRLTGDVDRDALQEAVCDLVGRHPALRTVFPEDSGRPARCELSSSDPRVRAASTVHVRECSDDEVDRVAREFALERVDITDAPPFGASLVTATNGAVLVLRTHHIVCDGWSAQVMAHDLGEAYSARRQGAAPVWAGTVLRRGTTTLDPAETSAAEEYWSRVLTGAPEELSLPVDRARPAQASFAGFSRRRRLDDARTRAVHALAERARSTPFAVLHALTATTLHRLGAGEDIVVGTPVAGRDGEADADVVDLFASTVVLRSRVDAASTFDEVLDRSRDAVRGALAHPGVPFERVVELLRPRRSVSAHPVFQVLLALDDTPRRPLRWDGLEAEPVTGESAHARFDVSIYFEQATLDDATVYDVRIECASDLFDPPAADLVWTTFTSVLDAFSHDPARRVGDVDVVPSSSLDVLLEVEQGERRADADADACTVHGLVLAAAASFPEQTALVDGTGPVRYAELAEWVDEVARRLVDAGVRPGDRVAVALPRSADMIAALLGAMASGAAYVPLDLSYPADRLGFLLDDSDPAAVLVPADEQPLPAVSVPVVTVPARPGPTACRTGTVRGWSTSPESSAYILYTSGTTGRPKGVVVSHAAAVNQLRWMQELIALLPGERVLQKTPTGFDVSVTEIFWPLSVGATLVVVRPDGHGDPVLLDRTVDEHGVSTAFYVPSMLSEHLATVSGPLGPVRRLVVTGEAVQPALVESVQAATGATFVNGYGPTEVAVHATSWVAERGERVPSRVPIGTPLRNVVAYVLDDRLRRVPLGVTGELYLAGVQLADGYHRRPGLTAQRFVANPFAAPGERMYRTGDLVRRRHDGLLEFFGRRDGQVKVRGVRVELGEIEHELLGHADVQEAVVVLQGVDEDRPRLVAHVATSTSDGGGVSGQDLRRALGDVLPPALVPDRVEVHARLPRLPNGKVDRAALPAVSLAGTAVRRAPATELERLLHAAVVAAVGHDELGMDDRFFDVGGDSIRSIAVAATMRQAGYQLALRAFYDPGTLAALVDGAVPVDADEGAAGSDDDWDVSELVGLTDDERDLVARAAASRAGESTDG